LSTGGTSSHQKAEKTLYYYAAGGLGSTGGPPTHEQMKCPQAYEESLEHGIATTNKRSSCRAKR